MNATTARVIQHPSGSHTAIPQRVSEPAATTPACGHHGCLPRGTQPLVSIPTWITLARVVISTPIYLLALRDGSLTLAFIGLGVSWAGDIADGLVARIIHQETRTGAVWDRLADTLSCLLFYAVIVSLKHHLMVPIALYMIEFATIDTYLSLSFLEWPIISANYFYLVDRRVFLLNWTPLAKSLHSTSLLVIVFAVPSVVFATAFVLAVTALKVYSIIRVQGLQQHLHRTAGCASKTASEHRTLIAA